MLRGLLIAVIAVSALNAEIWNEAPKKYVPGTEYEYIYDAQILSGIPTTSWHYTGYRLLTKVRMLVKEMTEITLLLENVEFLKINGRINENEPTVFLPKDLFEEMEVNEVKELIKVHLQRPMQFQWTNGVVRGLRIDKEDTFWSINMKKGLLNMLNMDLTPTKTEERTKWNGNYIHSRVEDGIEGMCNSIYHWNRLPIRHVDQQYHNNKDNVAMTMTKTRNLIDCVEKPVFEHALFLSENCDAARMNVTRDVIKSEATTHMNLTYWTNKKDFFAWAVKSDARYTFAPLNAKIGSMSTFVKQNLTFVSEKTIEREQRVDNTNMMEEETLQMTVPIPEIANEKMESELLTKKVFDLLNEIRPMIREKNTKVLTLIRDLVSLLRQSPKSIIEKVHKECQQQASEHPEVMEMFHDILPTVATKEAVEVIIEQAILNVQDRVEDDSDVARRVRMLGFMNNVVHEDLINNLLKVLKNPTLIKKTQRKETLKALLLTIGTLTKTYVHQRRVNSNMEFLQQSNEGKNIEEEVLKVFRDLLLNKEDIPILKTEEQMIVVLKAIGNSGIKKAFTLITNVIYSDKVSTSVRVQAIHSLRHLAPLMQREVREVVLPLFFDVTKDAEVRIASFVIAMKTKPTRIVLDSLVDVIRRDPIAQVRSFALSYLKTLVNTMDACQNDIVHNITRVLETLDIKDFGMQYSHSYGIPLTESSKAVLHTNVIWTPEEFLPRTTHLNLLAQNAGKNVQLMEIILRTEGLQNLLTKMLGPNGRLYTTKDIQSLLKEIDLNENEMEVDNRFSLGMKIFGEDMGYWALNENLRSVIQQGFLGMSKHSMQFLQGNTPIPLNWRRASYLDAIVRIPTTFGLPFTANLTSLIYAQIDGQVKLLKGITDKEMIHAQIKVNPLLFTEHIVEAGIDATITKAFTQFKLETHIPQTSTNKWTIDMIYHKQGNKQLRFFINKPIPQSQEFPLLQIKTTLRNHLMQVKPSQGEWNIQSEPITAKFMQKKPEMTPITKHFLSQFLAMKINLAFLKPQAYYVSRYPIPFHLMGDYMFELKVQNLANNPEEGIELRFITLGQPSQQQETSNQNTKFSMKVQLLRTTLQATTPEIETETSSSDTWNRNPKFRQSQGDEQMIEMRFDAEQTEERRVKFQILLDLMKIINDRFTVQGELKMPRPLPFDVKNPLKINFEENREPLLNIEATLKNKDEKEWMKYRMTVDMDEVALDIFKKMIENLEDYRAVHPLVEQCNKDIKNNYINTPACFFVWRYVNMYNRWNHTIVVDDKAPRQLQTLVRLGMITPLLRLRQFTNMVFPDFINDKLIDQQPGDENDLVFHKSFVASPFHAGVMTLNFVFDNIRVRFPRVVMPSYWLTHLHPSQEPMIKNFLREMTEGNYPATCNLRRVSKGKYQVRTFDGFLYENTLPTETPKGRYILVQDINNTIQVSSYYKKDSKIIQIVARDMKHIHVIRPFNGQEMTVLVDGKPVTNKLPLIVKNDNGNVILIIKRLTQNMYGIDNLLIVHMPLVGLTVKTDCISMTDIEVSPFYHTTLRGLCGNFDGETIMELKTRDCRGYFVHPQEIVRSNEYVLTDVKENQSNNADVNENQSNNADVNENQSNNADVNENQSNNADVNENKSNNADVNGNQSNNADVNENQSNNADVKKNQSNNAYFVTYFVQRYHREHQDVFVPLKVCRRGERLIPFVVTNTRTQYY
jgi:hypothetical protein